MIAQNPVHKEYLDSLCRSKGKYNLDVTSESFTSLYRDTVLKLAENGYLFDDDPELIQFQHEVKGLPLIPDNLPAPASLESLAVRPEDAIHFSQTGLFSALPVQGSDANSLEDYDVVANLPCFSVDKRHRRREIQLSKSHCVSFPSSAFRNAKSCYCNVSSCGRSHYEVESGQRDQIDVFEEVLGVYSAKPNGARSFGGGDAGRTAGPVHHAGF